nr:transposase [Sphingomonas rubra]
MAHRWRAVDHEGEVLESYVTRSRDKAAARFGHLGRAETRPHRPGSCATHLG